MTRSTTQTFLLGRFTLELSLDPKGRIAERWSPKPPVRLSPVELKLYNRAKSAWAAPVMVGAIPAGTPTRISINGKTVERREDAPSKPVRAIAAEVARQRGSAKPRMTMRAAW